MPWTELAQHQAAATIAPDTVAAAVVRTPLPSGVATVVRGVLGAPPWLIVAGVAGLLACAIVVATLLWRRRGALRLRFAAQPLWGRVAMLGVIGAIVLGVAGFSAASWNYTQHNNDFCVSCHVMGDAWTRFQESEHSRLQCHDCHQQPLGASLRQLYYWVAERPEKIPPHAKVPTRVCQNCHNQDRPDSTWQRVIATAGHNVHFRSDDPELKDVQCVTCHGAEVHHFAPVDKTCGQAGCHDDIEVRLGRMAGQTSLHCTGCHPYTVPVQEQLPTDSTRLGLVPARAQCLDCHDMRQQLQHSLRELDPRIEPHRAVCGTCHNPHVQEAPEKAFETCATAGCHARADTLTAFHRTLTPRALAGCGSCHKAHSWKARPTDCLECHKSAAQPIRPRGGARFH